MTTLLDVVKRSNYDKIIEEQSSSDLIIECVELLTILVGEKEFYELYTMYQRPLIYEVALWMMQTTPAEIEQMHKDPEQFMNLALDTCDKQKSEVIKTQGAKLLEAICDNIDGAVSFVTMFCC